MQIAVGKETAQTMFACQWSSAYGKNGYVTALTSEKKHWLKTDAEKNRANLGHQRKSSAATQIYSTSTASSSCLHAVAHTTSLCQRCPRCCHTLNWSRDFLCQEKITQPIIFFLKASLAPRTIMQQEDTCVAQGWEQCGIAQRWCKVHGGGSIFSWYSQEQCLFSFLKQYSPHFQMIHLQPSGFFFKGYFVKANATPLGFFFSCKSRALFIIKICLLRTIQLLFIKGLEMEMYDKNYN